jgi:hypothetical protein
MNINFVLCGEVTWSKKRSWEAMASLIGSLKGYSQVFQFLPSLMVHLQELF